ncbi:hypothetical protein DYBT9275_05958 [Dyadobacter sp. CECT 9275]|uniref:Uncharacterized protein n=1 Tax=Dyadobacter helix TaxID=2822344 RepID=A0A916JKH6_9BACT|nr:hypothetical protein [Dyadobacter sp. CECT 9275]CAG5018218.1 hypothetical protein DYBT9275_05958 [Dyadobacter sp. CECT 9275]
MIRISTLPLIEDDTQFYAAKLILLVDVLYIGDAPRQMREYIKASHGGFVFEKKTYMPITLTGHPESLLANAEKGIHFKFDRGFENVYTLNGNVDYAIWHKRLYDLSAYIGQQQIAFEQEVDFIIQRYLTGYREYPKAPGKLLEVPQSTPAIGTRAMRGFKPLAKR